MSFLGALLTGIKSIFNAGTQMPQRTALNISGPGASLTDDPVNGRTNLVISGGGATLYTPTLDGGSAPVVAGDSVVLANNSGNANVVRATALSLLMAPAVVGVVTVAASPGGTPTVQTTGVVASSITGLGPGAVSLVAVNGSTGKLQRVVRPLGGEAIVGVADANGNVTVAPLRFVGTSPAMLVTVTAAPYGADPTGAVDSTTAIQTALNVFSGHATSLSGIVYFPPGVYLISSALTYTGNAAQGVKFIGHASGQGSGSSQGTVLQWNGAAAGTMWNTYGLCGADFRDLIFNGNSLAAVCLWIHYDLTNSSGSRDVWLERCSFQGYVGTTGAAATSSAGVNIADTGASLDVNNISFHHCQFTGNNATDATGSFAGVQTLCSSSGNTEAFWFDTCGFQQLRYGFYGQGLAGFPTTNNDTRFADCQWANISVACITLGQGNHTIISPTVEVTNANKECVFLYAGRFSRVWVQGGEITIDATNNHSLSDPFGNSYGLHDGVLFYTAGQLRVTGSLCDATGEVTVGTIGGIQVSQGAYVTAGFEPNSVVVEHCMWGNSSSTAALQQIPVWQNNSGTFVCFTQPLDTVTTAAPARSAISLKHNLWFTGGVAKPLPDYEGTPPSLWASGLTAPGSGSPYYTPTPVFYSENRQVVSRFDVDYTSLAFQQNATSALISIGQIPEFHAIVRVLANVTQGFAGTGGPAITLQVGTADPYAAANDLLLAKSVASPTTIGCTSGELGASLASPVQGAVLTRWASTGYQLTAFFDGGTAALGTGTVTNLTSGHVQIFVTSEYAGYV